MLYRAESNTFGPKLAKKILKLSSWFCLICLSASESLSDSNTEGWAMKYDCFHFNKHLLSFFLLLRIALARFGRHLCNKKRSLLSTLKLLDSHLKR